MLALHDALLNNYHIKDEASALRYLISRLNIFSDLKEDTEDKSFDPFNILSQYLFF